jgi:hypothetical protein
MEEETVKKNLQLLPKKRKVVNFQLRDREIFGEERYEVATFDSVMDLWPWQTIEQWENADSVNSDSEVANTIQTKTPWELGTKFRYFALDKAKNSIRQHLRR